MANRKNTFLVKRSNVAGKVPTAGDLLLGELALNTADGILYASGTTANSIIPIGWDRVAITGDTMTGGLFTPYLSATTISATTYLNLPSLSGDYLPLSGGTVYGPTIFSGGLTANTLNVTGLTQTSGVTSTGGIIFPHKTLTTNYTATTSDYFLNITGDTLDVILLSAVGVDGKLLVVKNEGSGIVNVISQLGELIDDRNDVLLTQGNSVQLISDGVNWVIIGYNISSTQANTGVVSFSGLSKVSSSTFYVAPVQGYIVDDTTNPTIPFLTFVQYTGGTHTDDYYTTAFETFVYITSGGTIGQQPTPLTPIQRRQNIFLGKLGHPDKTAINLVFSQPDYILTPLGQLRDMFIPINLINGGVYPSVNTGLTINTSAGNIYGLGINFIGDKLNPNSLAISGQSPCTFQYRTSTGGTVTNTTLIDPLNYDLNGVITPISGTKATNQRIYLLQNGSFRIMYGQHVYTNFSDAVQNLQTETFTPFPNFVNNAVLICVLTLLSSTTDLSDTSKAQFFFASKFGETVGAAGGVSTTNLQQAYNNSSNPEIVINATLDGLSITNGTGNADNITRLLEGQTATNGVTSFIRADGYISGTTFQSNGFIGNSNGVTATTVSATSLTLNGNLTVTGNTQSIFSGNTSSDLVRITQTGSGNAFVVEDSATPDGNKFIIDNDGNVSLGLSVGYSPSKLYVSSLNKSFAIVAANQSTGGISPIAIKGETQGDSTNTLIGVAGYANDGLLAYGVVGLVGETEFGSTTLGIGGRFGSFGSGTRYSIQLEDNTEGVNKVLVSQTSDGKANWSSVLSGLTGVYTNTISATTYSNLPIDIRVTGGTYSSGTAVFTNNTGGTFTVTGFSDGGGSVFTGGTVSGPTVFTSGLSANTISATTYYNLPTDIFTTGVTISNGSVAFNRNDSMSAYTFGFSGVNINVISDDVNKRITFSASTGGGSSLPTLNNSQIFIGDTSNVAQARNVSGDIGLDYSGLTTIQPNVVTYSKMQTVSTNAFLGSTSVSGGTVEEIPMVDAYITTGAAYTLLTTPSNWDIDGVYVGTSITGTFQGQSAYDGNYWFTAVDDNLWIRLIRG